MKLLTTGLLMFLLGVGACYLFLSSNPEFAAAVGFQETLDGLLSFGSEKLQEAQ